MTPRRLPLVALLILLCLAGLTPASTRGGASLAQNGTDFQPGFDCSLLDDPQIRQRMSAPFELVLLERCGRFTPGPDLPTGHPIPAGVQSAPDVRVNTVDPIAFSTTQSETSIAINEDTGTICAHWNDSYHYRVQNISYIGFANSTDGGQTFNDTDTNYLPIGGGGKARGDPSVAWRAADGYFYATSIHESSSQGLGFWRSTDDCVTFEWLAMAHVGSADDKELMAIDNYPASPYYGRIYIAWMEYGAGRMSLIYSDNGTTWSSPVTLSYDNVQGAWPAVAPNGDVYVAWVRWQSSNIMDMEVARSTDGGASFTRVTNPGSGVIVPRDASATSQCGRAALNGRIRYLPSPQIVVGPDGCLHVTYPYDPDGYNVGDVINVYYRRSCDQGAIWGPEVQLNDDGGLTDQFFPAIAVNEDNVVAASWYDRRLDPASNFLFDRYWTVSYDGGITWEANERISDVSSPVYIDPYMSSCYHGDYDQMAADADSIHILWSDDRVFFNGHYDPDLWFERQYLAPDFTLTVTPDDHQTCRPGVVTSTVEVGAQGNYNQPVALSDSGLPAGVDTAFDPNPVSPLPGQATYTITVTESAADGTYDWLVTGSSPTLTHDVTVTLIVSGTSPAPPTLTSPPDGAMDVPPEDIPFQWLASPGAISYRLQVDDDPAFASPEVDVSDILTNSYTLPGPLAHSTTYHWRIQAANGCGSSPFSTPFSFTTEAECQPVAEVDLTWEPVTPTVGAVVTFTAEATGTQPISFTWAFGDGALAGGAVVTHTYTHSETYAVVLTATNPCGEDMVDRDITVIDVPLSYWVYLPLVRRHVP